MNVVLLGTGSAEGWPNPFCGCHSCRSVRGTAEARGHTAALVDGTLLLDCGPDVPRTAGRLGIALDGVRHLLLTHDHPDHLGPAALLWRSWAGRVEPLDLVGPASALAACADWIGPHDPVRPRPVRAGDRQVLGNYRIAVLAAAHERDAVLYDVDGPSGRLLYATDTGALPESTLLATTAAAYDVVLLDETFGGTSDHGTAHLDLAMFAQMLGELRARGAVTEATDVVAVHLGHHNPPPRQLATRLAALGARIVRDGDSLQPARTLVIGGARSGKSAYAEELLALAPDVTYVATAPPRPGDADWQDRVAEHVARRPSTWNTVETLAVAALLGEPGGPLLIDDLGTWLAAVADAEDGWSEGRAAPQRVRRHVDELVTAWQISSRRAVAVAPEVGLGVVPMTAAGRWFRDEMGRLNAALAAVSDEVVQVTAGLPHRLR